MHIAHQKMRFSEFAGLINPVFMKNLKKFSTLSTVAR